MLLLQAPLVLLDADTEPATEALVLEHLEPVLELPGVVAVELLVVVVLALAALALVAAPGTALAPAVVLLLADAGVPAPLPGPVMPLEGLDDARWP